MYATDRRRGAGDLGEESSVALPGVAGNRRTYARVCSGIASGAARTGNGVSVFAAAIALSGGGLYFLARFSRKPESHLTARGRACLVYYRFRGHCRARPDWFALAGCVCSRRNYFTDRCDCSDRYREPPARAAKNRHHFGGRESRQRRHGARRLLLRHCGDDERKVFTFRSKRALCFSRAGRHRNWVGGWLASQLQRRLDDPHVQITISLLTPFAAYTPAECLHVSGVLAVVASGLFLGWRAPRILTSRTRLNLYVFWEMMVFLLNGLAFVLIGLQLPRILHTLFGHSLRRLVWHGILISCVAVVVRIAWVFTSTYLV